MTAMTPRCMFDADRNGNPCGRALLGAAAAAFCPVHDRIRCTATVTRQDGAPTKCGHRLLAGNEQVCPQCGRSVRLQDVLRRGSA